MDRGARRRWPFLNLGGVGNLTWVDPRHARPEEDGALLAFDTGPANAPIDDLVQARAGMPCDRDGRLARRVAGCEEGALERFLEEPFFPACRPSRWTGRVSPRWPRWSRSWDADAAATLTAWRRRRSCAGWSTARRLPARLLVTGGGRHNAVMMRMLAAALDCPVEPVEAVGLDGDMLEAQAFAHLAIRVARGLPTSCCGTTGVRAAVSGGMLSHPRTG